jgi:alpha-1,2-mannosyltransferase
VFLVAACWWDLTRTTHRARGVLVGLSAAIKLVPAVLIGYLLLTRQWRTAFTATATWAGAWAFAWIVLPADSHAYVLDHVAVAAGRLGHIEALTNQSWNGLLVRSGFETSSPLWWLLAAATLLLGFGAAVRLRRATGRDHEAIVILSLAAVLATPVAWVHHAVWIVPALGLLLGDGRDVVRRRVAIGITALYALPSDVFFMGGIRVLDEAYLAGYLVLAVALTAVTLRRPPP